MNEGERKKIFSVAHFFDGAARFLTDCEVFVEDGVLVAVLTGDDKSRESAEIRKAFAETERIDEPKGFMIPGLINSHHHAYSALARGMPLDKPFPDFPARLENLWWRLDRALDRDAVRLSAEVTAMESVRHGCTTVIDHHSSPTAIRGSLDEVSAGFGALNMTRLLCYETTDRNGPRALSDAIDENLAFAEAHAGDGAVGAFFGLHASFTLGAASLERIAREKPESMPVHVHVAEDLCDVNHARAEGFDGPLERLHRFGLLGAESLVAHGVHLSDKEHALAADLGVTVAHNPESNLNNRVGYADVDRFRSDRIVLGTDGMSSHMLASLRAAHLAYSGLGGGGRETFTLCRDLLLTNPAAYLTRLLGRPVGVIVDGEPADFALFDYAAPTPVNERNLMAHLLFGLANAPPARWVFVRGEPVVAEGRIIAVDEAAILSAAQERSVCLWKDFVKSG